MGDRKERGGRMKKMRGNSIFLITIIGNKTAWKHSRSAKIKVEFNQ